MKTSGTESRRIGATLFEWDRRKAAANLKKHGVTFLEAATVFADSAAVLLDDPDHSEEEARFVLVGVSSYERLVLVVHVERHQAIRIISARRAGSEDRRHYEEIERRRK